MKLSLVLEVVSKGTARIVKMTGAVRDLTNRGMSPLARANEHVTRTTNGVSAATFRWTRIAIRSADAMDRAAARARRFAGRMGLRAIELGAAGAAKGVGILIRKTLDLAKAAASYGSLAVGAGAGWLIGGTLKTAAEFEQMQIALEGTEGSANKAKAAMAWVAKFAKDTPYEIGEVTDAFVRARGVGIDPLTGAMTNLGDAAGGARASLMDAVEALADAQTGEFERLKTFNITTSVKGDKVTFSYIDKAGKNASKSVTKSMGAIRDSVLQIFDEKYGGGMIRQSRSMVGIWNNIKDTITNIQLKVAGAGFFDAVKGKLQQMLEWLNKMEADGSLQKWAKEASKWLTDVVNKISDFVSKKENIAAVGETLRGVGKIIWTIAEVLARVVQLAERTGRALSWAANTRTSDWMGLTTPAPAKGAAPKIAPGTWQRALQKGRGPAVNPAWNRALRQGAPALRAPASAMGGKPANGKVAVAIELKGPAAAGARTRVASSSPAVSATVRSGYRGQAMGAPA